MSNTNNKEIIHARNTHQKHCATRKQLQDLGFGRESSIQAYFVCDKNVDLAANYLFEHQ